MQALKHLFSLYFREIDIYRSEIKNSSINKKIFYADYLSSE